MMSNFPRRWVNYLLLVALSLSLTSCRGKSSSEADKDSGGRAGSHGKQASSGDSRGSRNGAGDGSALVDLLEVGEQNDPSRFVEIEFGTFRVTHKLADEQSTILLKFRLYGV